MPVWWCTYIVQWTATVFRSYLEDFKPSVYCASMVMHMYIVQWTSTVFRSYMEDFKLSVYCASMVMYIYSTVNCYCVRSYLEDFKPSVYRASTVIYIYIYITVNFNCVQEYLEDFKPSVYCASMVMWIYIVQWTATVFRSYLEDFKPLVYCASMVMCSWVNLNKLVRNKVEDSPPPLFFFKYSFKLLYPPFLYTVTCVVSFSAVTGEICPVSKVMQLTSLLKLFVTLDALFYNF